MLGLAGACALVPLSSTMIAVALTDLERDLGVGVGAGAVWLVSGYLVVAAIAQPAGGRIGDVMGHGRAFLLGLLAFLATSVCAAVAPSFAALVAARAVQAAAGAMMIPSAIALLRAMTAPERRGRVFGWFGTAMGVGASLGPVIGGGLVEAMGWRATFLVNVPLGLSALALTARLRGTSAAGDRAQAVHEPVRRAVRALLRRRPLVAASTTIFLHNIVQYSLLLLVPLLAERRLGLGAGGAGLVLAAMTAPLLAAGPIGGAISDRVGRRLPAMVGTALMLGSTIALLIALPKPSAGELALLLAPVGLGMGLAGAPLQTSAVESAPAAQSGLAGGIYTFGRYIGGVVAAGLVALTAPSDAFGLALSILAVAATAALVACGGLPTRPPRTEASPEATSAAAL